MLRGGEGRGGETEGEERGERREERGERREYCLYNHVMFYSKGTPFLNQGKTRKSVLLLQL